MPEKEEKLKQSFQQVKSDIFSLGSELSQIKSDLIELKTEIKLISSFIEDLKVQNLIEKNAKMQENAIFAYAQETPTHPAKTPTHEPIPTDIPTHPMEIKGLLSPIEASSTGNQGVPTDKPTDRQTNQHINFDTQFLQKNAKMQENRINHLEKASEILASLDNLKKEVRLKFKKLTSQEMQVFSALYTLEEQGILIDYKILAEKLNLSESSIRDYIIKIQKKGIPISKEKLNNKRIILHISQELKKIASLNTIITLREL